HAGVQVGGRQFFADAVERGARSVVIETVGGRDASPELDQSCLVPHLAVINLKQRSGEIAAGRYCHACSYMLDVAAICTNGKTSCSQWLGSALSRLGRPTAVIGTLGIGIFRDGQAGQFDVTGYTTPDAVQLQRALSELRVKGATALAIEASSI